MTVQPLPLAISTLAVGLAATLRDIQLPRWLNYAIMFFFFAISVLASILTDGGFTGDPGQDLAIIITECAAVFALLESAMNSMSSIIPSPLGALAAKHQRRLAHQQETEAAWAAARAAVPPRASAVLPTPTTADMPTRAMPAIPPQPPVDKQ